MKYDINNSKRIYNLIVLKGKCLKYSNEHTQLIISKFETPPIFKETNFFIGISDVIDNLLFFFLNDEVSASLENRGPLGDIIACSIEDHGNINDAAALTLAIPDIQDLFSNRTDFMIGSNFLDFTVSSYSVFEKWISDIYEELRERKPSKNKKANELRRLISQYNKSDELEKEIVIKKIMDNCSSYVSGSEKIEFSMSMLTNSYERDIKRDREIIRLYRSQRNTIHNLGIHTKQSIAPININGIDISLNEGHPFTPNDFNSNIYICDELIEIYRAIINNLKPEKIKSLTELTSI